MIFAVQRADLSFTGVAYPAETQAIRDHHAAQGERLFVVERLVNTGTEAEPLWQPAADDIATARRIAEVNMLRYIEAFLGRFTVGVPRDEIASWPTKAVAAQLHLSGSQQPIIMAEAAVTGEDPEAVATAIAAKAALYQQIVGSVTGLRRKTSAAIAAAGTPEDVTAALAAARTEAEALMVALGLPVT